MWQLVLDLSKRYTLIWWRFLGWWKIASISISRCWNWKHKEKLMTPTCSCIIIKMESSDRPTPKHFVSWCPYYLPARHHREFVAETSIRFPLKNDFPYSNRVYPWGLCTFVFSPHLTSVRLFSFPFYFQASMIRTTSRPIFVVVSCACCFLQSCIAFGILLPILYSRKCSVTFLKMQFCTATSTAMAIFTLGFSKLLPEVSFGETTTTIATKKKKALSTEWKLTSRESLSWLLVLVPGEKYWTYQLRCIYNACFSCSSPFPCSLEFVAKDESIAKLLISFNWTDYVA